MQCCFILCLMHSVVVMWHGVYQNYNFLFMFDFEWWLSSEPSGCGYGLWSKVLNSSHRFGC
jgi:hypothetical protein